MALENLSNNQPKNKVVLIDGGYFIHRAIFASAKFSQPAERLFLSMVISNLKLVGCHPDDIIILALDSEKGSWRRDIDKNYKANRKSDRDATGINWRYEFEKMDKLLNIIEISTPFYLLRIDKLEADDIIATACDHYKDMDCVVISVDSDFEQLVAFPNTHLFSPIRKRYKEVKNPYLVLNKKLEQEKADNLISPILNEVDFEKRNAIVNLINLPNDIKTKVKNYLPSTSDKSFNLDELPFSSIRRVLMDIYNSQNIIPYDKPKRKRKKLKKGVLL